MPKLALHLVRRAITGEIAVRVELWSEAKPTISSRNYVDPDHEKLEFLVATTAGALAEHQNTMYGDRHDPDQIAVAAMRMIRKLKAKGEKRNAQIEQEVG